MGLGNPGAQYARTRHNIGFRVVDSLARGYAVQLWRTKYDARVAQIRELRAMLALPQTFMNDSGDSVAPLAGFLKIRPEAIVVVCDDVNLPFGRLRMRRKGSDGGHKGLKSIIAALGSRDFPRLRVGVGRSSFDTVGFVLGVFSAKEEEALAEVIGRAVAGIEAYLREGVEAAIAYVNAHGGGLLPPEQM